MTPLIPHPPLDPSCFPNTIGFKKKHTHTTPQGQREGHAVVCVYVRLTCSLLLMARSHGRKPRRVEHGCDKAASASTSPPALRVLRRAPSACEEGALRRGRDQEKYALFIHDSSRWRRGQPRSRVSDVIWQQMKGKEQSSLCSRLSEVSQLALPLVRPGAGQSSVCVGVSAWWHKHSCCFTVSSGSPSSLLLSFPPPLHRHPRWPKKNNLPTQHALPKYLLTPYWLDTKAIILFSLDV